MSKSTKAILTGVGTFVLCAVLLIGLRTLIRGIPIEDNLRNVWNWFIAAIGGISSGWSSWTKDSKGKGKDKE